MTGSELINRHPSGGRRSHSFSSLCKHWHVSCLKQACYILVKCKKASSRHLRADLECICDTHLILFHVYSKVRLIVLVTYAFVLQLFNSNRSKAAVCQVRRCFPDLYPLHSDGARRSHGHLCATFGYQPRHRVMRCESFSTSNRILKTDIDCLFASLRSGVGYNALFQAQVPDQGLEVPVKCASSP